MANCVANWLKGTNNMRDLNGKMASQERMLKRASMTLLRRNLVIFYNDMRDSFREFKSHMAGTRLMRRVGAKLTAGVQLSGIANWRRNWIRDEVSTKEGINNKLNQKLVILQRRNFAMSYKSIKCAVGTILSKYTNTDKTKLRTWTNNKQIMNLHDDLRKYMNTYPNV